MDKINRKTEASKYHNQIWTVVVLIIVILLATVMMLNPPHIRTDSSVSYTVE